MAGAFTVRVEDGTVKLYASNGVYQRTICSKAVQAEVRGDEVYVRTMDNKQKVYSVKGFYKKTL